MARQLSATPNIDAPDAQYPAGKIRDENPPTDGTPVQESLYGDIVQFFHKLMRLAGLTYNDVAENETSGFQFINALSTYIRSLASTTTSQGTIETATNAEVQAGTDVSRAVTPAGLESKTATETRKGISELGTLAELMAGTDTERVYVSSNLKNVSRHGRIVITADFTSYTVADGVGHVVADGVGILVTLPDSRTIKETITIVNDSSDLVTPNIVYFGATALQMDVDTIYTFITGDGVNSWYYHKATKNKITKS